VKETGGQAQEIEFQLSAPPPLTPSLRPSRYIFRHDEIPTNDAPPMDFWRSCTSMTVGNWSSDGPGRLSTTSMWSKCAIMLSIWVM
jgi:hypothetical protein